jgi:hypothetical protein
MKHSINEILENPEKLDKFSGFYDWFCKVSALENRANKLLIKLKFLVKEGLICGDTNYVWFKNNCPMVGDLYDDLRISNIETNDFLGGLCPRDSQGNATLWLLNTNNNDITEFKEHKWNVLKKTLKNDKFKKEIIARHFYS